MNDCDCNSAHAFRSHYTFFGHFRPAYTHFTYTGIQNNNNNDDDDDDDDYGGWRCVLVCVRNMYAFVGSLKRKLNNYHQLRLHVFVLLPFLVFITLLFFSIQRAYYWNPLRVFCVSLIEPKTTLKCSRLILSLYVLYRAKYSGTIISMSGYVFIWLNTITFYATAYSVSLHADQFDGATQKWLNQTNVVRIMLTLHFSLLTRLCTIFY